MESTISTKDLKSKLDQKQVTVVETLAPERYRAIAFRNASSPTFMRVS
jgi:hypothetical protein